MESMKLREQAGAGQGLPKSEFAHALRVASGGWAAACLAQRWITVAC